MSEAVLKDRAVGFKANWGWLFFFGLVFVMAGFAALGLPGMAALGVTVVLGWALIFSGVAQIVWAFRCKGFGGWVLNTLSSLLYLFAGGLMLARPFTGVVTIALVIAIWLIFEGMMKIALAFHLRPVAHWYWPLISGVASLVLAVLIFDHWPNESPIVIGILVGVQLIMSGWTMIMVALAAKNAP